MKKEIIEKIAIPSGITCEVSNEMLKCKQGNLEVMRSVKIPGITCSIKGQEIIFTCKKGNKNDFKVIKSYVAHVNNLFKGLNEKVIYELESCNVHFPMTMKLEGKKLIINNFLGEKTPRTAEILPNVDVQIKGAKITVSSNDKEAAGQTAANIEKATKIRCRDRRIFQDGIYIVEKPGRNE